MRVLVQRVSRASVSVDDQIVGRIDRGLLLFVGVTQGDSGADAAHLANKSANLRIFDDAAGQMNRSLLDLLAADPTSAAVLVVSQFTLYADTRKGRRPSYVRAAAPEIAAPLVKTFTAALSRLGIPIEQGKFGAEMAVELVNDGPVTIWLDSADARG